MTNTPLYDEQVNSRFHALVSKVLHGVRVDFIRELIRRTDKQILFCDLNEGQAESFIDGRSLEAFAEVEAKFEFFHYTVVVRDSMLYDALTKIDERARNIILMAFWLDMSDREIAEETGLERRTISNIRRRTYERIKKILKDDGYEPKEIFS